MRKNASSRTMDEDLKIFLGIKPEVEEQKPALAGMPAQEHEDVQAGMDENMSEQTGCPVGRGRRDYCAGCAATASHSERYGQ